MGNDDCDNNFRIWFEQICMYVTGYRNFAKSDFEGIKSKVGTFFNSVRMTEAF